MLFDKVKRIEIAGKDYPYKCDFNVLEKLQEAYGDVITYEDTLRKKMKTRDGQEVISPGLKEIIFGLKSMIEEGLEITGEEIKLPEETELKRTVLEEYTVFELLAVVHEEFTWCFTRKNEKATQKKEMQKEETAK